jgi:hypothetical protein
MSEVEAMGSLEKAMEQLQPDERKRVLQWAWSRYVGESQASDKDDDKAPQARKKNGKKRAGKKAAQKDGKKKGGKGGESYSIDRHLDLTNGGGKRVSFKDFVKEKKPSSAFEFNAVAIYYLKKVLKTEQVTLDHAYTCYSEAGRKPAQYFKQSFVDTKNKKGWVEFDKEGYLEIPHRGVVFVEHELPPKKEDQ